MANQRVSGHEIVSKIYCTYLTELNKGILGDVSPKQAKANLIKALDLGAL